MLTPQQQLAELGFSVFPCVPGGKRPLTTKGLLDATADASQIEAWSERWPNANWALRTDGLLVIDVDGANNAWFTSLGERARELAAAQVSITPRGGRHFIFRQPDGANYGNTQSVIADKVDTRANGGYIVVAPSTVDGNAYRWITELDVGPSGLPLPPQWILDLLAPRGQASSTPRSSAPCVANRIPDGLRNKTLFSLGCGMRRSGMSHEAIYAALSQENAARCSPPLDEREVSTISDSCSRYPSDWQAVARVEHLAEQVFGTAEEDESRYFIDDPGELPLELLRVPGFISEVMDYCLETAPYPNQALAFTGAMCLQAFLAARKVRETADVRTNLYCLGLANSSGGKDAPRKLNVKILKAVNLDKCIGERFSSGEGIQDALEAEPSMLFQTDEIDGLLQSINRSRDARYEGIMNTLLTLHSSSASQMSVRRKAGQEKAKAVNQPSLVMFGTAIPSHWYNALSERMLTNGFFSRLMIIEAGARGSGQEPTIIAVPDRVLETAQYWAGWYAAQGNISSNDPEPLIVQYSDTANALKLETFKHADERYKAVEAEGNDASMAVWGRVNENTRKLALLYAVSENPRRPLISDAALLWASEFATHQARRMLYMAKTHVSDNPFHELCQRVKRLLANQKAKTMKRSDLLRRLHVDTQALERVLNTLGQQGDVATEESQGQLGRPAVVCRLLRL
jgi:hypothetical protein